MRLRPLPSAHQFAAAALSLAVVGALLAPIAAIADEGEIGDPPSGVDVPSPDDIVDEVLDENLAPVTDEPTEDALLDHDPDDGAGVPGCAEPLAVISWDAADDAGDDSAVAITAQLLEEGFAGWASASWQAAPGTTLTAVMAHRVDGDITELTPAPTGTATDVVAFTFCGTAEPAAVEPEPDTKPEPGTKPQAPATVAECDDLLAVATPEAVEGDEEAVAITAQALDLDVPGWSNVGWEPAAGTTLRAVFVTGTDGTVTEARDATSATEVASLTFCGTVERPPPERSATPERSTAELPQPTEVPRPAGPTTSTSSGSSSTSGTSGSRASETPDEGPELRRAPDEPADAEPEADLPVVTVATPETPDESDTGAEATDADEAEVEVLGVQLTREDEPGGSGPLGTGVALLAVLALLATSGGVLWSRRS